MNAPHIRVLAAGLCAFLGGACTEPQAPNEAASLSVATALVSTPTLDRLQVSWVSANPRWFSGASLFTSPGDPYHSADSSVTTGSSLSFYLAFLASSFDPAESVPVEVRFNAGRSQSAYRLRRGGNTGNIRYHIQSTNPFVPVPFTVWDVSTPTSPRQLTVAWRDQNNSGTWDPAPGDSLTLEVVFIYNKTYDPTGTQQFSMPPAAIDNEATVGSNADIIYGLSLQVLAGHSLSESVGTLAIEPSFVLFPSIDIKPGSDPNSANCLNPNELIPVALLTTPDLDAGQVDPSTVGFGPARAAEVHSTAHIEDVDGDGDLDRVFHFRNAQTGLTCDDTQVTLFGRLNARTVIRGTDAISFVQTIRDFPATISPTNPQWGETVTITAGAGFTFAPIPVVTWPEGAARVVGSTATTIRVVPHWGSAGAPTITGVIAAKYQLSPLTLIAVLPEPFAVQAVAGNLPGTSTLATAPLVVAPGFINAGVFGGSTDCRVSPPCQLYKLNVEANGFKTFTITWSNTDDLGLYFLNAAGELLSYFTCDRFGIGATSQPETCTIPVVAGTMYLELDDFGSYYPGGAAANPPPTSLRVEFN